MVPTNIINHLKSAYATVCQQGIDLDDYSGKDADIAFDLVTAETFIVGIADSILEGDSPSVDVRNILLRNLLSSDEWVGEDGYNYSLAHQQTLLEYARNVEYLRKMCLKAVRML